MFYPLEEWRCFLSTLHAYRQVRLTGALGTSGGGIVHYSGVAIQADLTLGEFKVLLYIASRDAIGFGGVLPDENEEKLVKHARGMLDK
jgi:hypothetical protein